MSESITLSGFSRNELGKSANRRLRHSHKVPAIIYGGKKEPAFISIELRHIDKALQQEKFYSQILSLDIEGKKQQVILKSVQRHPVKQSAIHLDFLRVDATHKISTFIPIHFINAETCAGVKAGGKLNYIVNEIEVRCLPADLPEFIEVDLAKLEIGRILHLKELQIPEKVELVQLIHGASHDIPIVSVKAAKGSKDDDEETPASNETEEKAPAPEKNKKSE